MIHLFYHNRLVSCLPACTGTRGSGVQRNEKLYMAEGMLALTLCFWIPNVHGHEEQGIPGCPEVSAQTSNRPTLAQSIRYTVSLQADQTLSEQLAGVVVPSPPLPAQRASYPTRIGRAPRRRDMAWISPM